MQVFNTLDNLKLSKPVVTIGSFDGVHIGHCQVIDRLKAEARIAGGTSVVLTFWPHPSSVLLPGGRLPLLSTMDEKRQLLSSTGVDCMIVLPFTKEFSQIDYDEFVSDYLVSRLDIDTLLVGYDNKLGRGGLGNFDEVSKLALRYGFKVKQLDALSAYSEPVSSTLIRNLLMNGRVEDAATLLGRNYSMSGKVVHGNHIGTSLGFPTANLEVDACKFVPGNGVYAIRALVSDIWHCGMLNIGVRPTVTGQGDVTIEANLFGFDGDLYGQNLTVKFVAKVRDERQFASLNDLKAQLERDCRQIQLYFKQ